MGTPTQLQSTLTLDELAAKYSSADFIGDQLIPIFESPRKKIGYWVFDRRDAARMTDSRMAPTGMPNQRQFSATYATAEVEPFGLHDKIPLSDLEDPEPGIDLEEDTVEDLTHDVLMGHEKRIVDTFMVAGAYASTNKVTLGTQWSSTSSTPIADIQTGKRACAMPANTMAMDEMSWDALARHPDIIGGLRPSGGARDGLASTDEVAKYFGFEKILVGRIKLDTANPGQAAAYSYMWPQGCVLICRSLPNPRRREATLGRTLRFRPEGQFGFGVTVEDDKKPGTKGVRFIKVTGEEKVVMVASDLGYFISNAA